ncbi:hypothetical protein ACFQBQ_07735 [Granulicella cerasi]|uniref:Uncharacterized protein n=1 Tax=Granulicella cerasi TaxID=741063 RepID=A0ABW1Z9A7_9BACT|nr:hypothetical protein [Granulicella cerasi]
MITASALTAHFAEQGIQRTGPDATYVVLDDHGVVVCLTEADLDSWFASLTPELKASLYELANDGPSDDAKNVLEALTLRNGVNAYLDAVDSVERKYNSLVAAPIDVRVGHAHAALGFDPRAAAVDTAHLPPVESLDVPRLDLRLAKRANYAEEGLGDSAALGVGELGHGAMLQTPPVELLEARP